VVRATWEAVQAYFSGVNLPLRPSDRFLEDLYIDPEDIEWVAEEVAERSGHSLERIEMNPYYGRVHTVGDFVKFVSAQPRKGREEAQRS